jgi:hypothetical protein
VQFEESLTSWMNILTVLGSKGNPSKKPAEAGGKLSLAASLRFLSSLRFDPEDVGYMFLRNVVLSPNYTSLEPSPPFSSFVIKIHVYDTAVLAHWLQTFSSIYAEEVRRSCLRTSLLVRERQVFEQM